MRQVIVCTNLTLDGVMQSPARPDEDTRNGFQHGGWAAPYAAMSQAGPVFGSADTLLLGRRTYEDFYNVWPKRPDSSHTAWLTNVRKYVASRTLGEPPAWNNSSLLEGDAADAVRALKAEQGKNILIMGSGELIRSLLDADVIDEYVLLIHPLVLGSGTRLFPSDGPLVELALANSMSSSNGVVMATYRSTASSSHGDRRITR